MENSLTSTALGRLLSWLILVQLGWFEARAGQPTTNSAGQIDALQTEMNAAIQQVQKIVNQPVTRLARRPGMHVNKFQPGWFHEGAIKPDFNTVDVRATQEMIYDQHEYVTSDLNPGVVFIGRQLEFNSMTKYFYVDRSVPKKKLTQPEMLEINRLYRIIGRCEGELAKLQHTSAPKADPNAGEPDGHSQSSRKLLNPYVGGGLLAGVLLLYFLYRKLSG